MLDFPEDPGSPLSGTSYHQSISSGVVEHRSGFMRVSYVAIRDNRNGNTLLNCPNTVVLCFSIEETGTGSAMNSQGLNSTVFSQLGNLYTVTVFRCPTSTNFQRDWHIYRLNNGSQDLFHQIRILQQCRTCQFAVHFLGRAAHIDINDLRTAFHVNSCSSRHIFGVATGNLHGADPRFIVMYHAQT